MKTFKINKDLTIVCEWKKTRRAFKHEATLLQNGREVDKTKICYINRTWERFTFESVMKQLLGKTNLLTDRQKANFIKRAYKEATGKTTSRFKTIKAIASLSDVFGKTKKQKNDWKARILKAGLGDLGLTIPEDWNTLTENEKEKRLNGVIAILES